jgi:hypothetical protein
MDSALRRPVVEEEEAEKAAFYAMWRMQRAKAGTI